MLNTLLSFLYGLILLQGVPVNDSTVNNNEISYKINWLHQEKVEIPVEQFIIDISAYSSENTYLKIQSGKSFYLLNDTRLIGAVDNYEINLSVDSLSATLTSDTLIVFSKSGTDQFNYGFYTRSNVTSYPAFTKEITLETNTFKSNQDNFLIGLMIVFLILLSALKVSFPKKFQDVFSLSVIFSTRPVEGDNLRLRLFEQDGLFVALLYTFATAIIIYLYVSHQDSVYFHLGSANFLLFFQSWLLIIILLIIKISFIFFLSGLYKTSRINNFYIKDLINTSTFFISLFLAATILLYFYGGDLPGYWEVLAKNTLVVMCLIRMGLLYFKILKLSGFTYLYLFSYFCATEIFPFVIGLKYFY